MGSVLWVIMWIIVSVVWMIGSVQLEDFIKDVAVCRDSSEDEEQFISRNEENFAQVYVAIVSFATED